MPRFDSADEMTLPIPGSSFKFSGVKPTILEASAYTLTTTLLDISGSMSGFEKELAEMEKTILAACLKNPLAENLLSRVAHFNSRFDEIHGFKPIVSIDPADYADPSCGSDTALYDAVFQGIGATIEYAKQLKANRFEVNGAVYIVTDGCDNDSSSTIKMIAELVEEAKKKEIMESLVTILIGIDTGGSDPKDMLNKFAKSAGISQFEWVGNCTSGKLAKLAGFISKSISSTSQSLGSGGPSAPVALVI